MIKLGVNIDHVATVRQARKGCEPDPVWAAGLAEMAGADGITIHLREDRRHIQDRDVMILKQTVRTRLNLEMAAVDEIVKIAVKLQPDMATIVPERRLEVTTEGGLDVCKNLKNLAKSIESLKKRKISVSLFIDPVFAQIKATKKAGADFIELHTGRYADAADEVQRAEELKKLFDGAQYARDLGLRVNAGHGITYWNLHPLVTLPGIEEFNIGHSIISRAMFVGLPGAVREMKQAIAEALLCPVK